MVDHTIEAHFEVKASTLLDPRAAAEKRIIDALATAMARAGDADEARRLAPMIYHGIMALPEIMQKETMSHGQKA